MISTDINEAREQLLLANKTKEKTGSRFHDRKRTKNDDWGFSQRTTILFYSRLTFHGSITNGIYELFTWRRPEIYPKDSDYHFPIWQPIKLVEYYQDKLNTYSFSTVISQSICIGISVPQLLIYISSQPSKWVVPIGFAPSMRQRPTQHFISWEPLSARRPQAPESDFFSLPVGSIYIRRENPLQPQSFPTHVRDSGQNVRAVKHFTTGGGK